MTLRLIKELNLFLLVPGLIVKEGRFEVVVRSISSFHLISEYRNILEGIYTCIFNTTNQGTELDCLEIKDFTILEAIQIRKVYYKLWHYYKFAWRQCISVRSSLFVIWLQLMAGRNIQNVQTYLLLKKLSRNVRNDANRTDTDSEDPDQTAHVRSLIRAFAARLHIRSLVKVFTVYHSSAFI